MMELLRIDPEQINTKGIKFKHRRRTETRLGRPALGHEVGLRGRPRGRYLAEVGHEVVELRARHGLASPILATDYYVGGDKGWNLDVDFKAWVSDKVFKVGDVLQAVAADREPEVVAADREPEAVAVDREPEAVTVDRETEAVAADRESEAIAAIVVHREPATGAPQTAVGSVASPRKDLSCRQSRFRRLLFLLQFRFQFSRLAEGTGQRRNMKWKSKLGYVSLQGVILYFIYVPLVHNVGRLVDEAAFLNCLTDPKLIIDASGSTSVVLNEVGDFYFCSSVLLDCVSNLKIKITVSLS
nr:blue copper protein-like [Ipomoea batatas]